MALFDPDDLVRIARRIDTQSGDLRAKGHSLVASARQVRWQSTAATTFREQIDRLDHHIQHAAHNLERAADELRAHAHRVRTAEAALASLVRVERAAARDAERVVGAGIHQTARVGGWVGRHL